MKNRIEVIGSVPVTVGMLEDLFRQIKDGSIGEKEIQAFLEHRNPFEAVDYSALVGDWKDFYRDVFRIEADFSKLRIPEKEEGFDRLVSRGSRNDPSKAV